MTTTTTARVRIDDRSPDHPVVWVEAGPLRLGLTPSLGGRLMSLTHDGREVLWRNSALLDDALQPAPGHRPRPVEGEMSQWNNYGGTKTWPAPQGWSSPQEWAGPPDPVLDSGTYAHRVLPGTQDVTIELTSAPDPRTGLRLTRSLRVPDSGDRIEVTLRGENTGRGAVRWSLWDVAQLPGGGTVHVATAPDTVPVELVAGTGVPVWEAVPGGIDVPAQEVVGKLGFPAATGAMSYVRDGMVLAWDVEVEHDAIYPDAGARVEVWMEHPVDAPLDHLGGLRPPASIVECEVLGPLRDLRPGESMSLALVMRVQAEASS